MIVYLSLPSGLASAALALATSLACAQSLPDGAASAATLSQLTPPIAPKNEDERMRAQLLKELALIEPFAHGPIGGDPSDPNPVSRKRERLLEAAGEYCRHRKLDFHTALPGVWKAQAIIFAGELPGVVPQPWVILFRNYRGGLRELPLTLRMITLHPPGKRPALKNPEAGWNYAPRETSLICRGLSDHATVWVARGGTQLHLEAFDQGRPIGDLRWYPQIAADYEFSKAGIRRTWFRSTTVHAINFVHDLTFDPVLPAPPRLQVVR